MGDGGGHGLPGLAERLALVGGVLEVGPGEDGGTTLRARIPASADERARAAARPAGGVRP